MADLGIPRATYRLQLRDGRDFEAVRALVPYLAELGVSHLYLSPVLEARPGSTHGYDVADPRVVDPALGGEEGLRALADAAHAAGLGIVVDIVPNHLGTGATTRLWEALLAEGPSGSAGRTFDVDWEPPLPGAAGKVILPVLGQPYGQALEAGEIRLVRDPDGGPPRVGYYEHSFPLSEESLRALERAGGPEVVEGAGGRPRLHSLLDMQHYRLVDWRSGSALVNYRRFFAINDLAAVRVEDDDVFEATHATVLRLVADGVVDGLRIDHPDGLADPAGYLARLAEGSGGAWTVVEKILAPEEQLPRTWRCAGTTGYEFAAAVAGLFLDPGGLVLLEAVARDFDAVPDDPEAAVRAAKDEVLAHDLVAELRRLARDLWRATQADLRLRDVDDRACEEVLVRVLQCLDVYRTYVDVETGAASAEDVARIDVALAAARRMRGVGEVHVRLLDLLGGMMTGRIPHTREQGAVIRRFQQLSAATMAKGEEDTYLYRDARCLAANDVGFDVRDPAVDLPRFHRRMEQAAERQPAGMLLLTSHDTKRSEDVRVRIAALSEIPHRWRASVRRWDAALAARVRATPAGAAPDPHTRYVAYQTLVGMWPPGDDGSAPLGDLVGGTLPDRFAAYLQKAAREDGRRTSWTDPDDAFEDALEAFAQGLLDPQASGAVLDDVRALARRAAEVGMVSALAQVLLHTAAPGVPDTYQGTELWDDSLVDPDNRRPVDVDRRRGFLAAMGEAFDPTELWPSRHDGRVKLWVLSRALRARRDHPTSFAPGAGYAAVPAEGRWAAHVVAFARTAPDGATAVALAPRLVGAVTDGGAFPPIGRIWADTTVAPPGPGPWVDALTGTRHEGGRLLLADAFVDLPVALLVPA